MQKVTKVVQDNSNPVYGMGIFGALFYFIPQAQTFVDVLLAIFKSLFWPAFLVYELLQFVGV